MRLTGSRDIPPPLELQCLRALWVIGEGNVKEVREHLVQDRQLAYTTVMTLLDRLVRKGGVTRRKVGRSFVYAPLLDRDSLRRVAVRQLTECFFDGSTETLVEYLTSGDIEPPESPGQPVPETNLDPVLL